MKMPKPIPFPTQPKEIPEGTIDIPEQPVETEQVLEIPTESPKNTTKLKASKKVTIIPDETPKLEEIPEESLPKTEMPSDLIEENCVVVNGKKIEIKPTKLKYFRNKTASAYNILKNIPLSELLTISAGVLDEKRDGDQIVYDFLVAAFNDSAFVRDNYDELDANQIETIVNIVGRLNHIDEKIEAQRKNREAQGNR